MLDRLNPTHLFGMLVLTLVMCLGLGIQNAALSDEIESKEERIAQLEGEKGTLISRIKQERSHDLVQLRHRARISTEENSGDRVLRSRLESANSERRRIEHYFETKYRMNENKASVLAGYFYDAKRRAEKKYEVELDVSVLAALSHTESRFRSDAVSSAGALGIMQVMPKFHLSRYDFLQTAEDLKIPELNIRAGIFIFAEEMKKYGAVRKAIRAYHGGARGVTNPRASTMAYQREILKRLRMLQV